MLIQKSRQAFLRREKSPEAGGQHGRMTHHLLDDLLVAQGAWPHPSQLLAFGVLPPGRRNLPGPPRSRRHRDPGSVEIQKGDAGHPHRSPDLPDEVRAGKAKQIERPLTLLHLLFTNLFESLLTNLFERRLQVAGLNGHPHLVGGLLFRPPERLAGQRAGRPGCKPN